MDILSLPDEMLVSVVKYIKFDELRNLRKTSQRIDRVAKRADLGVRVEVTKIGFHSTVWKNYADYYINNYTRHRIVESLRKDHTALDLFLARVSVLNALHFIGFLDETILTTIEKQKKSFRQVKKLDFDRIFVAPSSPVIKSFMIAMGTTLEEIRFTYNDISNMEGFFDPEIYSWRTWKSIAFHCIKTNPSKIDDNFLLQVASKCETFSVWGKNSFTLEGTIALLKKCMLENRFNQKFYLYWVVLGNIPYNRVADFFKDEFESAHVVEERHGPLSYKIRLRNEDKTYVVRFCVPEPRD